MMAIRRFCAKNELFGIGMSTSYNEEAQNNKQGQHGTNKLSSRAMLVAYAQSRYLTLVI